MTYHLAQLNIARMLAPIDDPLLAEFVANLDRINALADHAPGFVWRLQNESGNATELRPFEDDLMIVNMSVWESLASLKEYVYKSAHAEIMRKRRQWFEKMDETFTVLWWVPAGTIPTIEEAKERLQHLRHHGETAYAFSFRRNFDSQLL
ncbi:MAG: DUF3291 domain-containing protein [Caldilineaceae bacterium]